MSPPSPEWPDRGNLTFKNFSLKYRTELDNVLSDISATILAGEKIGIVGRTGTVLNSNI